MKLHKLKSNAKKSHKIRLGRGAGSGKGKTSGRGHKGQKSRSGYNLPRRFEGGQTSFIQRVPKARGFKSLKTPHQIVNLGQLEIKFAAGEIISPKTLLAKKLIDNKTQAVKILANGKITKKFIVRGCLMSSAAKKILMPEKKD